MTRDNFQKRGGIGPNICILCFLVVESMDHLFVNCPFTMWIWNEVAFTLNVTERWCLDSLDSSLKDWSRTHKFYSFKDLTSLAR